MASLIGQILWFFNDNLSDVYVCVRISAHSQLLLLEHDYSTLYVRGTVTRPRSNSSHL